MSKENLPPVAKIDEVSYPTDETVLLARTQREFSIGLVLLKDIVKPYTSALLFFSRDVDIRPFLHRNKNNSLKQRDLTAKDILKLPIVAMFCEDSDETADNINELLTGWRQSIGYFPSADTRQSVYGFIKDPLPGEPQIYKEGEELDADVLAEKVGRVARIDRNGLVIPYHSYLQKRMKEIG